MTTAAGYLPSAHGPSAVCAIANALPGRHVPRYVGEPQSGILAAIDSSNVNKFKPHH